LLAFDNSFDHEGESYSKLNLTRVWLAQGRPYPDSNFGPLHTWLLYVLHLLTGAWVWPARWFGLLTGTLTVALFFWFVKEEFDSPTAVFAALLFAAWPTHLRASPTGLAETPYLLFFVIGLLCFTRAGQPRRPGGNWLYPIAAALAFTAAGMIRFEAWLFFPMLCLVLWKRRGFWPAALFASVLALFPLWHMFVSWRTTGDPTGFAKTSALSFLQYMPDLPMSEKAPGWILSLVRGLGLPTALLVAAGLLTAVGRRRHLTAALLVLIPFAVVQYKAVTNTMDPSLERYIVSMATLLLPYGGLLLAAWHHRWLRRRYARFAAPVVVAALMIFQVGWAWRLADANQYPADIKAVVQWLRANATPQDRILPDQRFHPYVQIESGLPLAAFVDLEWTADRKALNETAFARLMTETPPTIVLLDYLLADNPAVNSNLDVFSVPPGAPEFESRGLRLTLMLTAGDFAVYRAASVMPGGRP
jgi:4-amino-4-deoxy-L-arabinose transferase-like glycosyltransferase